MRFVDIENGIIINGGEDPYQKNVIFKPDYAIFDKNTLSFKSPDLVEIDDLMILPVILLNKLGYKTKYCCSGHDFEFDCHGYILFEENIFEDEEILNLNIPYLNKKLKDVPFIEINNNNSIYYKPEKPFESNAVQIYNQVLQFNKFIMEFISVLPDRNSIKDNK